MCFACDNEPVWTPAGKVEPRPAPEAGPTPSEEAATLEER